MAAEQENHRTDGPAQPNGEVEEGGDQEWFSCGFAFEPDVRNDEVRGSGTEYIDIDALGSEDDSDAAGGANDTVNAAKYGDVVC